MGLVSDDVLEQIRTTAMGANMFGPAWRSGLLAGIAAEAVALIEEAKSPGLQLGADLRWCNGQRLANGKYALPQWLKNAADLARAVEAGKAFSGFLETAKLADRLDTAMAPVCKDWAEFFNRQEQEDELDRILEGDSLARRPLAFVVGGPEGEFHDGLHERLARFPLPRRLRANWNRPHCLLLPAKATKDRILRALEDALDVPKWGPDVLPASLTYFRAIVQAEGTLEKQPAEMLDTLFSMLSDPGVFPDLPERTALCVGISIVWQHRGPSQKILQKRFPRERYPRARFGVLPELTSPTSKQARAWVDLVVTLSRAPLSLSQRETLRRRAEEVFGKDPEKPMRDLYHELTRLAA